MKTSEDNSIKAAHYVMSYIVMNGGSQYADIDWEHKPKGLPEDVSRAWDVVVDSQKEMMAKGVEY